MFKPARLAGFYALAYWGMGWYQPFLSVLLARHGYPGWAIGVLATASPAVSLFMGPYWGRRWDLSRRRRTLLLALGALTLVGAGVPLLLLGWGLWPLWAGIGLWAAVTAGIIPIGTAATLGSLANPDRFGELRLIGSVTFAVSAAAGAWVYSHIGFRWLFFAFGLSLACAAWLLPDAHGRTSRVGAPSGWSWVTPPVRWFLVAVFLAQLANAGSNTLLGVYYQAHLPLVEIGWPWAATALVEAPVFFLMPRWLARFGPGPLLALAMVGYALRLALLPLVGGLSGYLAVGLIQAVAFSGFYGGQVAVMDRLAPPAWRGSAQSLLASAGMGVANVAGALASGVLYSALGARGMFWVLAAFALLGAVTFAATTGRRLLAHSTVGLTV